jgi:hypothetical protein
MNTAANSVRLLLPFSVYGEALFIQVQNFVIIWLVWKYNNSIKLTEKIVFTVVLIAYSAFLFDGRMLSEEHWALVTTSSMGLTVLTRVPQIYETFAKKSTG